MKSDKVEIKGITLDVNGKAVTISIEDARALYEKLEKLFGVEQVTSFPPVPERDWYEKKNGKRSYEITC